MRQMESDKVKVVLALKGNPIVLVACRKVGIPTSTFYRWKNDDKRFTKEVNRAIAKGREPISDIAEAHLIKDVKKGQYRAYMYWLKVFRAPYKKTDKSIIEVQHKNKSVAPAWRPEDGPRKRKDGVLLPSYDLDAPIPAMSKDDQVKVEKLFKGLFKKVERERVLMQALRERGASSEEVDSLLKGIKEF